MIIIGIDPGIANTGLAIIKSGINHDLLFSECVKTDAGMPTGARLEIIEARLHTLIEAYNPNVIGVESVFFNANVSSCLDTAKVIGIAELVSHTRGLPCELVSPQQAKRASGMTGKATKKEIISMANLFFRGVKNNHIADAAFIAIAAYLKSRRNRLERKHTTKTNKARYSMASKKSAKKRKIRNRKPNPNAYHRHRRGGNTFAERRGKEIQIAEIQDRIALLRKTWQNLEFKGLSWQQRIHTLLA